VKEVIAVELLKREDLGAVNPLQLLDYAQRGRVAVGLMRHSFCLFCSPKVGAWQALSGNLKRLWQSCRERALLLSSSTNTTDLATLTKRRKYDYFSDQRVVAASKASQAGTNRRNRQSGFHHILDSRLVINTD